MLGNFKVACHNSADNTHAFLEWCKKGKVDIAFVGECWRWGGKQQSDTPGVQDGVEVRKGKRVVAYWRKNFKTRVIKEDMAVEASGHIWIGVYAKAVGMRWTGTDS